MVTYINSESDSERIVCERERERERDREQEMGDIVWEGERDSHLARESNGEKEEKERRYGD